MTSDLVEIGQGSHGGIDHCGVWSFFGNDGSREGEWKMNLSRRDREEDERKGKELGLILGITVNDFTPIIFANWGHMPNRGQLSTSTSNSESDPN